MISYTPPYALHPRTALTPLKPPNQVPQHETNWALHTPYNPYIPLPGAAARDQLGRVRLVRQVAQAAARRPPRGGAGVEPVALQAQRLG